MLRDIFLKVNPVMLQNNMYKENRKSLNWFVGCRHNCVYCKPSFQAQMKRQLHNCKSCYLFEPHSHLERLAKAPPRTNNGEFIFYPSSGDPSFASLTEWIKAIEFTRKWSDRTFLIQTKNTGCFLLPDFPDNVILDATIETNKFDFLKSSSNFMDYFEISQAPLPYYRIEAMKTIEHKRKAVTIEPILEFDESVLVDWIKSVNPEFVYVGYDNHNCRLPEPSLEKTQRLIENLEKFTEVRLKTIRKAWWEPQE